MSEEHLPKHPEGDRAAPCEWNAFILEGEFPARGPFIHFPAHFPSEASRRRCCSAPPKATSLGVKPRKLPKPLDRGDDKWRRRVAGELQRFCQDTTLWDSWIALLDCRGALSQGIIQSRENHFSKICNYWESHGKHARTLLKLHGLSNEGLPAERSKRVCAGGCQVLWENRPRGTAPKKVRQP